MFTGRFAPSPSGRMHLGNLYAALLAWLDVRSAGGRLILRMEDLDPDRCRPEYAARLADDLRWLGLDWDEGYGVGGPNGPYVQSGRTAFYDTAFRDLEAQGLIYPCFCSRADRLAAAAPHPGEEQRGIKPCPCRFLSEKERAAKALTKTPAYKIAVPDETISFTDRLCGPQSENLREGCGDFILRRADGVYAYQLAVTVDDGLMGVTQVLRGRDLLDSTPRQIWLLRRLGYPVPDYCHVPLLVAQDGRRLSKREKDFSLTALRTDHSPEEIIGLLACLSGLRNNPMIIEAEKLIFNFSLADLSKTDIPICTEKMDLIYGM